MKRIFSISLAASIASFALVAPAYASFSDVPSSHTNAEAIAYVQAESIVSGYPDGTFKPDQTINRAEFVKMITGTFVLTQIEREGCLHEGGSAFETDSFDPYLDVALNAWFEPYVCIAANRGLVDGYYSNAYFRPADLINFAESSKILSNVFNTLNTFCSGPAPIAGEEGCVESPDHPWYEWFIRSLEERDAIPLSITAFDQSITRGEMAEMIYRLRENGLNKPTQMYESLSMKNVENLRAFSSQYFTLSFKVPTGFEVTDNPNAIAVSKGPLQEYAIGGGSAFLTLVRYDQYRSRDDEIALTRRLLKNQKESMITVDGEEFFMIEGDDYGRYEGTSAGKIVRIFFPKSMLEIQERPGNEDQDFDPITIGKQILSTFRFSK
jgi:hypothetical protein